YLLLDRAAVEQAAAGEPVDLRSQAGDPIFVIELKLRLALGRGADQVIPQDQIGGRSDVADRKEQSDTGRQTHDPGRDGEGTDPIPSGDDDPARLAALSERLGFSGPIVRHRHPIPSVRVLRTTPRYGSD